MKLIISDKTSLIQFSFLASVFPKFQVKNNLNKEYRADKPLR